MESVFFLCIHHAEDVVANTSLHCSSIFLHRT